MVQHLALGIVSGQFPVAMLYRQDAIEMTQHLNLGVHVPKDENPCYSMSYWIPACAGMTE